MNLKNDPIFIGKAWDQVELPTREVLAQAVDDRPWMTVHEDLKVKVQACSVKEVLYEA